MVGVFEARRGVVRAGLGVLVVVVLGCSVVGGCLMYAWWQRPPTDWVPLPPGIEKRETLYLGGSLPPPRTKQGRLELVGRYAENREWVAVLQWKILGEVATEKYSLRLGESVHVAGLGTVTLQGVIPPRESLPWEEPVYQTSAAVVLNLNLDAGIVLL